MRRSVEDAVPVLERIQERIFFVMLSASAEAVEFHLQPAYQSLANADAGSASRELSNEQADQIEKAARHLEGIQIPAELRAEALVWSRDLRALL
jgi:hypothetical protein